MKTYGLASFAVVALWLGLSALWMARTETPWVSQAAAQEGPATPADPAGIPVPMGPVMIDLSRPVPLGPVMTGLVAAPTIGTAAGATLPPDPATHAASAAAPPPTEGPVATSPRVDAALARLQDLEVRLTLALDALEQRNRAEPTVTSTGQAPSFLAQLGTVVVSAPVIGFLVMLLLALAVAAWGQPSSGSSAVDRLMAAIHRLSAPAPGPAGSPPPDSGDIPADRSGRIYGQTITHILPNGQPVQAGVFDENQVRAAAGLTLALGAVAFAYAALGKVYLPIQTVTTLFFVEFLIRIIWGVNRSPLGLIAGWMTLRDIPHWVSAKPKRFAWSLGLGMSLAMMLITNGGIRGPLPLTICVICLTLMWLEAVLGLCLGCEMHRLFVRWGWMQPDKDFEVCSNGACTFPAQPQFAR